MGGIVPLNKSSVSFLMAKVVKGAALAPAKSMLASAAAACIKLNREQCRLRVLLRDDFWHNVFQWPRRWRTSEAIFSALLTRKYSSRCSLSMNVVREYDSLSREIMSSLSGNTAIPTAVVWV
jgi:hypothetical protein